MELAWIDAYASVGIKVDRSWVSKNGRVVGELARRLNRELTQEEKREIKWGTFDFSTLYTKLNIDDLVEKLHAAIDLAFQNPYRVAPTYTHIRFNRQSDKLSLIHI